MCGIAGIYLLDEARAPSLDAIDEMTIRVSHRGPDEGGVRKFPHAALGNRRLKIIDLQNGQQPMGNETGSVWITFNGEIYNYQTLRDQMAARGHTFRSMSDTEVIIHAYEAWALGAISRLDGQFAIALYNEGDNELLLARDRLGIKPLYYTIRHGHLIFASEIKSILAHPLVEARFNPRALTSYLSYRYPLGSESWYADIFMLQPGELLVAQRGQIRLETYWSLPSIPPNMPNFSETEMVEEIRTLLDQAVRHRMISDVPVGAYLSGGLDSSIVAALMAQHSSKPVETFTIGFEEDDFNEFPFARMVADRYATNHHEITLQPTDYIALLPDLIRYKDAPLSVPNEVPLYVMSKELKRYITVVLSGEGADELFAGYGRIFRSPYDFERMGALIKGDLGSDPAEKESLTANLDRFYSPSSFESHLEHFLYLYAYTPLDAQRELFTPEFVDSIDGDIGLRLFWQDQFASLDSLSHYDQYRWLFQKFHLSGLLLRLDMTTMATAVEGRVPFVDHHLVEYVLTHVPFEYLLKWRSPDHQRQAALLASADISEGYDIPKYLLRRAFESDLPKEILMRKKIGFPVPLDRWLQEDLGELAREILLDSHTRQRGIFRHDTLLRWLNGGGPKQRLGQIIWMLVNIELWFRAYIDGRQ